MTTKRYLEQIEWLERAIKNKLVEIERLDALIKTIPALPYDKDKVMSSSDQDKLGCDVAKLLDEQNAISSLFNRYLKRRDRIIQQIESISEPKYLCVLSLRYLEYKELYQVSNETGYSYSHVKRLHKEALNEFEKKFGKEYLSRKLILNEPK